jgi:steroid delta-isomerase-like uncharacterized protein
MSEENKAIVRNAMEQVWHHGNLDAVDEYYAEELVNHTAPANLPPGRDGFKMLVSTTASAIGDPRLIIEDQVAEEDKVATRWSLKGQHIGDLAGIPATGKQITLRGIVVARLTGGRIAEIWGQSDQLGLMQQIGDLPPPGEQGNDDR